MVAGTGTAGYSGDGGPATEAQLNGATGLAIDSEDNLYVVDNLNGRVRRVDGRGVITTVAGGGGHLSTGDGGPATTAMLGQPQTLAFDPDGNLYIGEYADRIRRVNREGVISLFAGGRSGFGGDGGPPTSAALQWPRGIAFSGGALYIADDGNYRVRRVGSTITTVAGNGQYRITPDASLPSSAWLEDPLGMAISSKGEFVLADGLRGEVRRIDLRGLFFTFKPFGSNSLNIQGPRQMSYDAADNLYIGQAFGCGQPVKIAANGTATQLNRRCGVGFSGDGGNVLDAVFYSPHGIMVAPDGQIYVADTGNNRIRVVRTNGIVETIAGTGERGFGGDGGRPFRQFLVAQRDWHSIQAAISGSRTPLITEFAAFRMEGSKRWPVTGKRDMPGTVVPPRPPRCTRRKGCFSTAREPCTLPIAATTASAQLERMASSAPSPGPGVTGSRVMAACLQLHLCVHRQT